MIDFVRIAQDNELKALAVIGSRARGDFTPYSDLDLIGVSSKPGFKRFPENGLVVELHLVQDVTDWAVKPSWWYALNEMSVKIDDGTLARLPTLIEEWRRNYQPTPKEIRRNRDWLESVMRKLRGSNSDLTTSFLISTNLWEILAGVFIARGMPVPANAHMRRLAPTVLGQERFEKLVMGNVAERQSAAIEICNETIEAHNKRLQAIGDPGSPQPEA